jgi:hypothetical protein
MTNTAPYKNSKERSFTALYDDTPQELKGAMAWVYAAINRHCMMSNAVCFASFATLARECRVSEPTVQRCVRKLIFYGLVEDRHPGNNRTTKCLVIEQPY